MKERMFNIKKGIIASLFLLIIGGIIVNFTFFLHAHKNDSGKIIFHAHPFDKGAEKEDPLAEHSHSKINLDYISTFTYFIDSSLNIDINLYTGIEVELSNKPSDYSSSIYVGLHTTRGPPQISFSS